jgi:hypothetical protein
MKKLIFILLVSVAMHAQAQNVGIPQTINPPSQIQNINEDDNQPVQVAFGNNFPHNTINTPNIQIQQKVPVQQITKIRGNLINWTETNKDSNPPTWGQSIHVSSGYSGSSAVAKHHAKKSVDLKYKKAFKVFEKKYRSPHHYGHIARIKKCHGF